VVQNRSDYVRDGLDHLQDPVTYRELSGDPTNSLCNNITPDLYNDGLLNKESINLCNLCAPPENARLVRLYFLKKTHTNPKGIRPIVSLCGGPAENISRFVDHWLQPIIKELPSYLKDTSHLIRESGNLLVPNELILATIPVYMHTSCGWHCSMQRPLRISE